jgi:hypothetical protein
MEAASHNAAILQQFNHDLNKAISAQPNSQVSYGSEFKSPEQLQELLQDHPHWPNLRNLLTFGATFPLSPISDVDRKIDLEFHLQRGNHQSVLKHDAVLEKLINNDMIRGFALPLPISILPCIPNASLAPLGCHKQETINEFGEHIPK